MKKKGLEEKAGKGAAVSSTAVAVVPAVPAEATLVGQFARVTDDALGFGVSGEIVEILSFAGGCSWLECRKPEH